MATFAPKQILDLGRQFNIALPAQTLETLIPHVQVTSTEPDLVSFLTKLDWGVKVLASLDACRRVAFENIEDAARNGLHYGRASLFARLYGDGASVTNRRRG
ncbi:adenosine deaminase [Salmonella enterica subsp. enterica]|nr:adenosine deaminase [Salmonella enterica subsp. enterica]